MDDHEIIRTEQPAGLVHAQDQAMRPQEVLDVSSEEVPHLLDYWHVLLKRRWVVLTSLLIVFSTVAIGALKERPVYEGEALIEINPEQPNVLNFKEILQIDTLDPDSYRETQYQILRSRTLAERVVRDLQLYLLPEFYESHSWFGLVTDDPLKGKPPSANSDPPDPSSEVFRNTVDHFQTSVDVSPVVRSNLVDVGFESEDPKLAATIATTLAQDYIKENLQVKWDETITASEWLQTRLTGLKASLEKSEDALQAYAQANNILFITEKQDLVNSRLEQLEVEYTKAQADRFQKESLYSLVQTGKIQDLPGVLSNQLVQELTVHLSDLEREYAQLTATVKPSYPKAVALKRQIDAAQASLDEQKKALVQNIVDDYKSAVARENYLGQAVAEQKKEVNSIADKTITYNILKHDVDTNKQLYDGVLQRLKEAQVSAGLKASNIRIVDPSVVPDSPVKPRVLLDLALGAFLGLGLGVGLAFFQEYMDNTLKTPDEVEGLLQLPSLGLLPAFNLNGNKSSDGKKLALTAPGEVVLAPAIQTNPASVEAFRSLRTSILLSAHPVPKIILITSALPEEGKTTTTVNLGATLASLGSKVVVVDCDMRRPACHRSMGVENKPGFVQCLTGHVDLSQAVLSVPGVPNLSVIPCGPIPPNPAEILSSPVAAELLTGLRAQFDYVLVDSPPLLSVSDARILATVTDATVLVVRAFETPYQVVRRAKALLYGAGARVLGIALNNVDFRRAEYGYGYGNYRRYGYGYGYGAVYGQETEGGSAYERKG